MANLLTHIAREFGLDALTAFRKRWHAAKQAVSHSRALWTLTESGGRLRVGVFPWRLADPPEERPGVEVSLRLRPTIRPGIGLTLPPSRNHDSDAYLYAALPLFGQIEVWLAWPERFRNKSRQKARTYEVRVPHSAADTTEDEKLLWGLVHNAKSAWPVSRPLWVVVRESVGCGSAAAQALCRRFERDPDEAVPGIIDADSGSCSVCGNTTCPECETVSDADYCRECFRVCESCGNKVPREEAVATGDGEDTYWICPSCAEDAPKVEAAASAVESVCCARCGANESPDKAVQGPHGEVFCSDTCATEALCGGGP